MNEAVVIGLLSLVAVAACIVGIKAALLVRTAIASRNWPTVKGRVVSMEMDVTQLQYEEMYTPRLVYRYRVGGQDYESSRIDLARQRRFFTQASANAVLAPYRPDGEVTVYYNPGRPSDALLQPGGSVASWLVMGLVVALLLLLACLTPVVA
jgi:hypothetical protein